MFFFASIGVLRMDPGAITGSPLSLGVIKGPTGVAKLGVEAAANRIPIDIFFEKFFVLFEGILLPKFLGLWKPSLCCA